MKSSDMEIRGLKACTVCARAKVRCDMVLGQKRCTRCERLHKNCHAQPRGSHSRRSSSKGRYKRESVYPTPATQSCPTDPTSELSKLGSSCNSIVGAPSSSRKQLTSTSLYPRKPSSSTSSSSCARSASPSSSNSLSTFPLLSKPHHLVNQRLQTYRQDMMPLFPFVWISQDESPDNLFRERPMLYMAILVVTCQENIEMQQELAQQYREELGRRIWTCTEKNIQLLQGIVVYLAWNQTHSVLGDQLSSLMHMAMSLVTELGLDKEYSSEAKLSHEVPGEASKNREHQPFRTNDERRCYLGVFWLNSTLNSCAKYIVPMPKKSYINDSYSYLEAAMESPWDTYLVQLVRIQEIYNASNSMLDGSSDNECQTSQRFFMQTSQLERQVQELGTTLHQESRLQAPLAMSFHMLQASVYKFGIDKQLRLISEASDPSSPTLRYSYLVVSCLSAVKAVIKKFLLLSASTILSMPYTYWIQIVHSVEMFARLLVTHSTLWDPNLFVGVRDFTLTLGRISNNIEGAMREGAVMDPPRHLPATIDTMREKLIDICALVGESSKTMSGSSSLTTTNSQHATHMENMVMDKETQSLLVNFIRGGSLM